MPRETTPSRKKEEEETRAARPELPLVGRAQW